VTISSPCHPPTSSTLDNFPASRIFSPDVNRNLTGPSVRVLTWNILADGMAQNGNFTKTDPSDLDWSTRWRRIRDEIQQSEADILLLQECNHFEGCVVRDLATLGYTIAIHQPKADSPALQYGAPADGVAVFARAGVFRMIWHLKGGFRLPKDSALLGDGSIGGDEMNQGYIIAELVHKQTNRRLIVATSHFKAKKSTQNDLIRQHQAIQMRVLLDQVHRERLESLLAEYAQQPLWNNNVKDLKALPVIFAGDLNCEPSSFAVQALLTQRNDLMPLQGLWASLGLHAPTDYRGQVLGSNGNKVEGGALKQVCPDDVPFTTWKYRNGLGGEQCRIIDHFFWNEAAEVRTIARMPSRVQLGKDTGLPSACYPSDHLAVVCEFQV